MYRPVSFLSHPDNDHWAEWRQAVNRTGYNEPLARASRALQEIDKLTPASFEYFTANLYRNSVPEDNTCEDFVS